MQRSFTAITANAAITFFGFMALTYMNFEIGADLGLNLVKGILLSFLSVMIFLPALTVRFYSLIDKTSHKQLFQNKFNFGKHLLKLYITIIIIFIIFILNSLITI